MNRSMCEQRICTRIRVTYPRCRAKLEKSLLVLPILKTRKSIIIYKNATSCADCAMRHVLATVKWFHEYRDEWVTFTVLTRYGYI